MKLIKKALLIFILLLASVSVYAQPRPPQNPTVGQMGDLGINRPIQEAPVAPATFLLLGLGASAVGVKLYRNSKKQ